jgi:hypothetical protein
VQLPLGDALEPRPLEGVRLDAPLGRGPLGQEPLEYAPRDPDHAAASRTSLPFALTATQPRPNGWGPSRPSLCCSRAVGHSEEPH